MSPTLDAFLCSWPWDPWLVASLALVGGIYGRGWRTLERRDPRRWHVGRLGAFLGGLVVIFVALASPIEPFAGLLLAVHMVQHFLLMMVAPVLLWLGAPLVPLLRGLPRPLRRFWLGPLLREPRLRNCFQRLTHPAVALPLFMATTWFWHVPMVYELALRSQGWHYLQHACFVAAAMLFWYPVVRPYPSRPLWSNWLLLPYLIVADVQNTVLAALFTFSDHVLYPYYAQVPRLEGVSALQDQATAGVIMWVPGSVVFLVPVAWIALRSLYGSRDWTAETAQRQTPVSRWPAGGTHLLPVIDVRPSAATRPPSTRPRYDLLRMPLVGRFLRWRHARLSLQVPCMVLAGLVICDGLRGPQVSPMNLAGVLPWIHWRGLLILGLLSLGNVFCLACPFTLPRTLARRCLPAGRAWPRWLRNKWLAVALLVVFLWAYEALALWDSPWWTAVIACGYFVAAFAVDSVFRGAAFCKYLCPIGQFNFVQSLVSPWEIGVRDAAVCTTCSTKDCLRGRDGIPGCELQLFQPRKVGNMDCTFCLDCVHACPHENVGILAIRPSQDLEADPHRSGVGRFSKRPDLAALIAVLVFGAFANAAGMIAPVVEWQARRQADWGLSSPLATVTGYYLLALLVVPSVAIFVAAGVSRRWGRLTTGRLETATRYCYALVPLGFAMWLAHYSFHFLTSYDTIISTSQRFLADLGCTFAGEPQWVANCCRPIADWLPRLEIIALDVGLLGSLYTGYRIAQVQASLPGLALRSLAPWGLLMVLLFAAGIWIVCQPMQMRGTLLGAG